MPKLSTIAAIRAGSPKKPVGARKRPMHGFFLGYYRMRSAQVEVSKVARSLATLERG